MSVSPAELGGPYEVVFDVGAFQGDFARACLNEWKGCIAHSFEPLAPEPRDVSIFARYWHWYAVALGADAGVATMYECTFVPSSSLLPMADLHRNAFPYTRGSIEREVPVAVLDDFADVALGKNTLLKIDVQGYELEVLKGAGETLDEVSTIVLEVSHRELYHGAPDPEVLAVWLRDHGFSHSHRVDALYDPRRGREGDLLQSDEVWVR